MVSEESWMKEYHEFVSAEEASPPLKLTQAIVAQVRRDLCPSSARVFTKLVLIVIAVGALSLFLCPQFGISFMRHSGLHGVFMHYLGRYGCNLACGAFFSMSGITAAFFLLRPEEFRVLQARKFLLLSAVSALSLSLFVALGAVIFMESALLWFLGSLLGALGITQLGASLIFVPSRA